jgi:hypothetical protein
VHLFQTENGPQGQYESARQALAESDVVVQCTGYQPRLPALNYASGGAIGLLEVKGGLDSDPSGCPLDSTGQRLHGLHLFGLGAGLAVDPRLGSEASFDGRIYGVWQFHHDASSTVIDAVLARLQEAAQEQVSSSRKLSPNREVPRMPFLWPTLVNAHS